MVACPDSGNGSKFEWPLREGIAVPIATLAEIADRNFEYVVGRRLSSRSLSSTITKAESDIASHEELDRIELTRTGGTTPFDSRTFAP